MELSYKGSFFRDLDEVNNRYVLMAVKEKIAEIKSAKNTKNISQIKQFKSRSKTWFKTEITVKQTEKFIGYSSSPLEIRLN